MSHATYTSSLIRQSLTRHPSHVRLLTLDVIEFTKLIASLLRLLRLKSITYQLFRLFSKLNQSFDHSKLFSSAFRRSWYDIRAGMSNLASKLGQIGPKRDKSGTF